MPAAINLDIGGNTSRLNRDIEKTVNKVYNINLKTRGEQPLGRITGQINEFNKSLDASNARVIAFGASAGIIYGVQRAFESMFQSMIDVQKSLQDINVILNVSTADLNKFGGALFDIAKNTGQSFEEAAKAATEFSRQGLGVSETLKRTNEALILSRLSGLDATKSVEALTAAVNSFANQAVSTTEIVNKFANVDAAFAVSSADLAEAISRVGSSAAQSGVSLNELIAIVTSAQQTTARGGAVIGNSFKTIFTRLQRGKVIDLLGDLGISDINASGGVKTTIQLLQDLANVYDTLDARTKASVAEQVGGVFQINILKAALADLGKEYSIYNSALNIAAASTNQAITKNDQLNKTYAAQINALKENAKQLAATGGERLFGPLLERVVGGGNALLGGINESDGKNLGSILGKGLLDGLGQVIAGPGLVLVGGVLLKLFSQFTKFALGSTKELLGLNAAAEQQASLQLSINQILQKNPALLDLAMKGEQGLAAAAQQLLINLQAQTIEMQKQAAISAQIAKQFYTGGVRVSGGVPVAPMPKGKAAGYIPNFVRASEGTIEKQMAMSLGATPSVRPMMSRGTIGGRKFVMNNQEVELPRVGANGDSAVIPMYGRGYIPNFVSSTGLAEIVGASKATSQRSFAKAMQERGYILSKTGKTYTLEAEGKTLTFSEAQLAPRLEKQRKESTQIQRQKEKRGEILSKNQFAAIVANPVGSIKTFALNNFIPLGEAAKKSYMKKGYDLNSLPFLNGSFNAYGIEKLPDGQEGITFNSILNKHLSNAGNDILNYITQAFGSKATPQRGIKDTLKKHEDQVSSFAGYLFEDAAAAFLSGSEFATYAATSPSARFDFTGDAKTIKDLFNIKEKNLLGIEAKLNSGPDLMTDPKSTSSVANKIYSVVGQYALATPTVAQQTAFKPTSKGRTGKAAGYIPNFANPLGAAIARERSAGVPSGQIYVGQHRALASGYNPLGLGVFNTRDEPTASARNAAVKNKGYATGYIPNFAEGDKEKSGLTSTIAALSTELIGLGFLFQSSRTEYKQSIQTLIETNKQAAQTQLQTLNTQKESLRTAFQNNTRAKKEINADLQAVNKKIRDIDIEGGPTRGQKFKAGLQSSGMAIGLMLPVITSTIKQTLNENTKGGRVGGAALDVLGQTGTFAGMGAMFGPWGAAIGAATGALLTVPKLLKEWNTDVPEFANAAKKAAEQLSQTADATQKFLQAMAELQAGIQNNLPQEQIDKLKENVTQARKAYNPQQQERIVAQSSMSGQQEAAIEEKKRAEREAFLTDTGTSLQTLKENFVKSVNEANRNRNIILTTPAGPVEAYTPETPEEAKTRKEEEVGQLKQQFSRKVVRSLLESSVQGFTETEKLSRLNALSANINVRTGGTRKLSPELIQNDLFSGQQDLKPLFNIISENANLASAATENFDKTLQEFISDLQVNVSATNKAEAEADAKRQEEEARKIAITKQMADERIAIMERGAQLEKHIIEKQSLMASEMRMRFSAPKQIAAALTGETSAQTNKATLVEDVALAIQERSQESDKVFIELQSSINSLREQGKLTDQEQAKLELEANKKLENIRRSFENNIKKVAQDTGLKLLIQRIEKLKSGFGGVAAYEEGKTPQDIIDPVVEAMAKVQQMEAVQKTTVTEVSPGAYQYDVVPMLDRPESIVEYGRAQLGVLKGLKNLSGGTFTPDASSEAFQAAVLGRQTDIQNIISQLQSEAETKGGSALTSFEGFKAAIDAAGGSRAFAEAQISGELGVSPEEAQLVALNKIVGEIKGTVEGIIKNPQENTSILNQGTGQANFFSKFEDWGVKVTDAVSQMLNKEAEKPVQPPKSELALENNIGPVSVTVMAEDQEQIDKAINDAMSKLKITIFNEIRNKTGINIRETPEAPTEGTPPSE